MPLTEVHLLMGTPRTNVLRVNVGSAQPRSSHDPKTFIFPCYHLISVLRGREHHCQIFGRCLAIMQLSPRALAAIGCHQNQQSVEHLDVLTTVDCLSWDRPRPIQRFLCRKKESRDEGNWQGAGAPGSLRFLFRGSAHVSFVRRFH